MYADDNGSWLCNSFFKGIEIADAAADCKHAHPLLYGTNTAIVPIQKKFHAPLL